MEESDGAEATSSLRDAWRSCNVVCFDVDSTVSLDEGIDVLAAHAGAADAVAQLTRSAMSGALTFEAAIAARLALIKPTRSMIQSCLAAHPVRITPGAPELVSRLHKRGAAVYLVSGGFADFVLPVAHALGIAENRVIANRFVFAAGDEDAPCIGLDPHVPTCRSGGKAAAISLIQASLASELGGQPVKVAMVGDGATDLEAAPPADVFVGFGGVVIRDSVLQRSKYFVRSFEELIVLLVD